MKSPRPRPPGSLLVVEDNPEFRRLLVYVLRKEGYRTAVACDGLAALRRLRSGTLPRLILLDLRMPVMSGWELARILGEDASLASIPVLAMSGEEIQEKDLRLFKGRLEKPIHVGKLLRAVARFFK
jgi:CheY-like chemotaxis protein